MPIFTGNARPGAWGISLKPVIFANPLLVVHDPVLTVRGPVKGGQGCAFAVWDLGYGSADGMAGRYFGCWRWVGELADLREGVFGCEVAGIAIAVGVLSGRTGPVAVQAPEKTRVRSKRSLKGGGCIFMWSIAPFGREP